MYSDHFLNTFTKHVWELHHALRCFTKTIA